VLDGEVTAHHRVRVARQSKAVEEAVVLRTMANPFAR